ncbi:MAG: energy-coupling factor ABC transporter substrate-binding protein [Chloroflexi bacterium]|nr:energy-coupling factor ABC transporter substrate-binding protein [Chloroflexota bacterium]
MKKQTVFFLVFVVIALAIVPLFMNPGSEFGGADGEAEGIISEVVPNYEPWFEPLWSPPGGETESLLFALQAALGAGVIGYYFGVKRGQKPA